MKKRRCLSGAEGADAEAASEAETAKHPDVTEIKLCFVFFRLCQTHFQQNLLNVLSLKLNRLKF